MSDIIWKTYTPEGFDSPPTTVVEALQQARAVLEQEGRWTKGNWYMIEDPTEDPDTPFCDNWQTCAEGAVAMVSVGAFKLDSVPWDQYGSYKGVARGNWTRAEVWAFYPSYVGTFGQDDRLYTDAVEQLRLAGQRLKGCAVSTAYTYNDHVCFNRGDVLAWFDKAIEMATETEEQKASA